MAKFQEFEPKTAKVPILERAVRFCFAPLGQTRELAKKFNFETKLFCSPPVQGKVLKS
jgi:hypothetical protein